MRPLAERTEEDEIKRVWAEWKRQINDVNDNPRRKARYQFTVGNNMRSSVPTEDELATWRQRGAGKTERMSDETLHYRSRLRSSGISMSLSRADEEGSGDAAQLHRRPESAPVGALRRREDAGEDDEWDEAECASSKHWICWDTGELEPPGLQTRLIQPWPTPAPPRLLGRDREDGDRLSPSKPVTPNPRAEKRRGFPSREPLPDRSMFRNREVAYYDQPSADDRDEQTILTIAPTFRAWHTLGGSYDKGATFRRNMTDGNGGVRSYRHPLNTQPVDLLRAYRGHSNLDLETSGGGYYQAPVEYYPRAHHPGARTQMETYVHHDSSFRNTQPLQRGFFIIHPDWVSERQGMKPKSAAHFTSSKGPNGFRYGSK